MLDDERQEVLRWSPDNRAGVTRIWVDNGGLLLTTGDGQLWRLALGE